MPELPEVETTRRGIIPYIENQLIEKIVIRQNKLRWPVPTHLARMLKYQPIQTVSRRGKYLLFSTPIGTLILHLGMSGSLRILTDKQTPQKHEHIDICFANKIILRYKDPRRFGALLWTTDPPQTHILLKSLGLEPLAKVFTGQYLWRQAQTKSIAIKNFIMDSKIVVGVGNIYAAEALFAAGIHPATPAKQLSLKKMITLTKAIKKILRAAIQCGGTTLKDFSNSAGKPGYFKQQLNVYAREGAPCYRCQQPIRCIRLGQRSTFFCQHCQPTT